MNFFISGAAAFGPAGAAAAFGTAGAVDASCANVVPATGTSVNVWGCMAVLAKSHEWLLPSVGAPAAPVKLVADPSLCLDVACDQTPCFKDGVYGPDARLRPCAADSATFTLWANGSVGVSKPGIAPAGSCLDVRGAQTVQAYPCVGSPNQQWKLGGPVNQQLVVQGGPAAGACAAACASAPPDPDSFCPRYHPIHDGGVYDPSGPLLDDSGTWHQWEDEGGWSHWTSTDLMHWTGSFTANTTNFGGDTGSVSPTASGVYAFWPIMSGEGKGAIGSAKAANAALTQWDHRGATIPMPSRINTGYRDPVRAFQYESKWYVGVGCGNKEEGAQFCLFEAADDTLANFTDRGSLYTTNTTFGEVDGNIVWQPNNVSANMMECPDLFPLGDKWVLIGSLYKTNQWWVGTLSGSPPRFTPERVGILDYGNGYAAKSGSTMVQGTNTRRLIFGFTGWSEPTAAPGCGRTLIMPRELGVRGSALTINPVNETQVLRSSAAVRGSPAAAGSQVEVRVTCSGMAAALAAGATGKVGVRTLATADGAAYTELGYDFSKQAFYADHSRCCAAANTIVQRAPLRVADMRGGDVLELAIFVDGGLIEAFASELAVIAPLVAPDASAAAPDDRTTTTFSDIASLACTTVSYKLAY